MGDQFAAAHDDVHASQRHLFAGIGVLADDNAYGRDGTDPEQARQ